MSNDFPSRHPSRKNRPTPRRDARPRTTDREVVQSDELSSTSGARMIKNGQTSSFDRLGSSNDSPSHTQTRPSVRSSKHPTKRPSVRSSHQSDAATPNPASRTGEIERINVGHTGQFTTVTAGQTGEFARVPSGATGEFARASSNATNGFAAVPASQTGGFSAVPANQTGSIEPASPTQTGTSHRIPLGDPAFDEAPSVTDANIPKVASYGNESSTYRPYQGTEDVTFRGFHAAPAGATTDSMKPLFVKAQHSHKRKKTWPRVVAILAVLVVIGFGGFFGYQQIVYGGPITATVNGETMTLEGSERTIDGLLDNQIVQVSPGNFIAVDNSVIEEGKGTRASAIINETQVDDLGTHIMEGDVVVVSSGTDVMEDYTDSDPIVVSAVSERIGSAGALHVFLDGQDGEKVTRTGKTSGKTVESMTKNVINDRLVYYNANSNGDKVIALTFDDGPNGETTDEILDILKANDAKATFYTIGTNASKYPDQIKRAAAEGHEIATHSWDHAAGSGKGASLDLMSTDERIQEVEKGLSIIKELTGKDGSQYFRAPGGNFGDATANDLKALISGEIGWNVDTQDWTQPGSEVVFRRILLAGPGEIVLLHDGGGDRSQTVAALRDALPILKEQGYRFITVSELIENYPYQATTGA